MTAACKWCGYTPADEEHPCSRFGELEPPDESAAQGRLDYLIGQLREVAKERPEETVVRWPYNAKVQVEADDARVLLEALDAAK